ncbi:MAG: V-type ATPase subunit [Desulfuromonadaceae bacterium]|nr:V-type ATPase subunit [Desulfuromonadaceae bacterium]
MRTLLRDMPAEVPVDTLVARIRGRRSLLVHDWERVLLASQPLAALSAAPWRNHVSGGPDWQLRALQQEYLWVFSRMDEKTRGDTAPFFWLAEVRILAISLRLLNRGGAGFEHLLRESLLSNRIRTLLCGSDGSAAAMRQLTTILSGHDPRSGGLGEAWRTVGGGGMETVLYEISLASACEKQLHPAMRRYLELMIDSRNLTTIAKRLRWRLSTIPPLVEGGTLPPSRLAELFELKDNTGLLHLAMRLGCLTPYNETVEMEQVLYEAQRRVMRRLAREPDGVGVVLDYLWRCGNEAANIGLLERLESMGGEYAEAELRR